MYIETKEIGPEGLVVDRRIGPFRLPLREDEAVEVGGSHLVGELQRETDGVAFAGDIESVATLTCSRCLEAYGLPLNLHFDLLYTTRAEEAASGENRILDDEVTRTPYDGVRIDLSAMLSEQIYLGLPLKPLCGESCRGLCPRCGANRNQGACGCPEERTEDPRLRTLKDLL
jgi:uncharacterized protein